MVLERHRVLEPLGPVRAVTESAPLTALRANARRLRGIYAWLTVAGASGCGVLGAYLASGEKLEGPAIAAAVVVVGLALVGGAMLLLRWRWDAKILRTLLRDPQGIARVFRKETETTVHGATTGSCSSSPTARGWTCTRRAATSSACSQRSASVRPARATTTPGSRSG